MRFTILSHAGLLVEHNGIQVICDPWLINSCYWRSWWNFPEPSNELINNLKPDFIYLTHLHWDHFHGVSLKSLFSSTTKILIPKSSTHRMVRDLNYLGFQNITEIPHGSDAQLGENFTLSSYQAGIGVDSAVIFSSTNTTLLNCNDCKIFGLPLKQISNRFPKIDFVFKSHSSASPIPYCVEGYKDVFPNLRTQQNYIEEFSRFSFAVGARYAIPFASNHCFLHRETYHFNDTAVRPEDVQRYFQKIATKTNSTSECIVMTPGSYWCDKDGFQLNNFNFTDSANYIDQLRKKHQVKLNRQYKKEEDTLADFAAFYTYFIGFLKATPWIVKKILKARIVFQTNDSNGQHYWLLDMTTNEVVVLPEGGGGE